MDIYINGNFTIFLLHCCFCIELLFLINFLLFQTAGATDARIKRQSDDSEDVDPLNTDEMCQDRPADEYFRATLEGDCRDVVR